MEGETHQLAATPSAAADSPGAFGETSGRGNTSAGCNSKRCGGLSWGIWGDQWKGKHISWLQLQALRRTLLGHLGRPVEGETHQLAATPSAAADSPGAFGETSGRGNTSAGCNSKRCGGLSWGIWGDQWKGKHISWLQLQVLRRTLLGHLGRPVEGETHQLAATPSAAADSPGASGETSGRGNTSAGCNSKRCGGLSWGIWGDQWKGKHISWLQLQALRRTLLGHLGRPVEGETHQLAATPSAAADSPGAFGETSGRGNTSAGCNSKRCGGLSWGIWGDQWKGKHISWLQLQALRRTLLGHLGRPVEGETHQLAATSAAADSPGAFGETSGRGNTSAGCNSKRCGGLSWGIWGDQWKGKHISWLQLQALRRTLLGHLGRPVEGETHQLAATPSAAADSPGAFGETSGRGNTSAGCNSKRCGGLSWGIWGDQWKGKHISWLQLALRRTLLGHLGRPVEGETHQLAATPSAAADSPAFSGALAVDVLLENSTTVSYKRGS